ncbi:LOW QUALITY PROTEIN: kynurenine formamidase-like, partial [Macrobrachium nipponense]|uniref:LOW QUALITY PROTEIN: kynurenine formamidase-like n=1 Tax=Macrobrachium nipponense TaxID=159736 RepID=UPI0030C82FA3
MIDQLPVARLLDVAAQRENGNRQLQGRFEVALGKDMTVEEYSPSQWSERLSAQDIISAHVELVRKLSEASRTEVPNRLNVSYGSGEKMGSGCVWKKIYQEVATVASIVEEVRKPLSGLCKLAQTRGSKGVVLCGHSAGGHLVFYMEIKNLWKLLSFICFPQVLSVAGKGSLNGNNLAKYKDLIKGCIPISGVFDLRPLVKTYVNEPLNLTESSAWELSPFAGISEFAQDWQKLTLMVAVGDQESPEFQRQSKEYYQRCLQAGMKTEFMLVNSADHFNIVE